MATDTRMWVYAEFHDADGEVTGRYWLNHHDQTERACLGMRCADTFAEGGSVYTARVSGKGIEP